ncbi:hypothetical protein E1200_32635 [Actinomadura sp. GC306]|uniref:hypothetical protein n=1 Tax=Actinomadura sp. GC306 TaxID=2530367 RepID=UPI00104FD2DA|nr:hypothetical protein [Actinomadura sp. GC306]TDC59016.1 hypothetical protein E1200_32635 [Actinomadura sp. GC306]
MTRDAVYETRFGLTGQGILILLTSIGFCSIFIFVPDISLTMRLIGTTFFGLIGTATLGIVLTRRVALRVDADGVTLAGYPIRYRATLLYVPWTEVQAIVLWAQHGRSTLPYIGIRRNKDARKMKPMGRVNRWLTSWVVPHIPLDLVQSSRPIINWRLDHDRLAKAVATHAPDVQIVNVN